jgi:hypothetical protein
MFMSYSCNKEQCQQRMHFELSIIFHLQRAVHIITHAIMTTTTILSGAKTPLLAVHSAQLSVGIGT